MTDMRRRAFVRFFLCLLLAQVGLAATAWFLLDWGLQVWLRDEGIALSAAATAVAAEFQANDVCAIAAGDTTSPAFTAALARLRRCEKARFPRGDATAALFAVMDGSPRPWLSLRVADYPPYVPDDGHPPPAQSQNDADCIRQVIAGAACYSPRPYGGAQTGEAAILSGYAPLRDERGRVRAVVAVDGSVGPLHVLREASASAFRSAVIPALAISLLLAWVLTLRVVDPIAFLKDVQQAATLAAAPVPAPPLPPFLAAIDIRWAGLSEREREVARYVGQTLSTKEIAERMVVQESTVKQHLKNIYRALEIHSREELVVIAVYKFGFG